MAYYGSVVDRYSDNYLAHFGIPGQRWGVRRFQNEDGTLTEAGKARYYDSLSDSQKKEYDKLSRKHQQRIEEKMSEGKSFSEAKKEVIKRDLINSAIAGAAYYSVYLSIMFPGLRRSLKRGMLTSVSKIVNTKAVGGTLLRAKKLIDHMKMRRAGAIFVKAKDVWISGDRLGR